MTMPWRKALILSAILAAVPGLVLAQEQVPVRASSGAQSLSPGDQAMLERASVLMKNNDVAAARLIYKKLAGANVAEAAFQLVQTYDQDFLKDIPKPASSTGGPALTGAPAFRKPPGGAALGSRRVHASPQGGARPNRG